MKDESKERRPGKEAHQSGRISEESQALSDMDDSSQAGETFRGHSVVDETGAGDREDPTPPLEHRLQMEARRLEHELEMEVETLRTQRDLRRHELELNHRQRALERELDLKEQERLLERRLHAELASRQRELAAKYMSTMKAEIIEQQFAKVSEKARGREIRTFLLLGILLAVAAGSVYAGRRVEAPVFWPVAGTIFFMSCVGIIVFAAAGLGASAQMVELIRMQFRSDDPSTQSTSVQFGSGDTDGDIPNLGALLDAVPTTLSGKGDDGGQDAPQAWIEPIGKHADRPLEKTGNKERE